MELVLLSVLGGLMTLLACMLLSIADIHLKGEVLSIISISELLLVWEFPLLCQFAVLHRLEYFCDQ
jgi:hypothetical protein